MSLTGRPRSPPLALTSSSQIFWASSADLPLGASPPVSAILKPILIGSPDCAQAAPAKQQRARREPRADAGKAIDYPPCCVMLHRHPPMLLVSCLLPHLRGNRRSRASGR